jgi:hypothetical protein
MPLLHQHDLGRAIVFFMGDLFVLALYPQQQYKQRNTIVYMGLVRVMLD